MRFSLPFCTAVWNGACSYATLTGPRHVPPVSALSLSKRRIALRRAWGATPTGCPSAGSQLPLVGHATGSGRNPRVRWPLVTISQGFSTRAIHAGQDPDSAVGSVVPPIYATSTFIQDKVGEARGGYEYSRSSNPTRTALEECMAALESGKHGLAFASGLAAEDTLLRTIASPGSHFVVPDDAYGGTFRLFARVHQRWGVAADPAHLTNLDSVAAAITPGETKAVWIETPTNPLLNVADIAAIADLAHAADALVIVDNTFATPYLQQPLELGADVVVHSTTKYCGGHSDIIGGALVVNDDELAEQLRFHQNAIGGVASPFDCWLVLRGLRTLAVRMDRHCDNAEQVAAFLDDHARIAEVYFPGLNAHPGHDLAKRQMSRYGGMVSFRVVGGEELRSRCAKVPQ